MRPRVARVVAHWRKRGPRADGPGARIRKARTPVPAGRRHSARCRLPHPPLPASSVPQPFASSSPPLRPLLSLPPPRLLIPHTTGVCNARQWRMRCSARGRGGGGAQQLPHAPTHADHAEGAVAGAAPPARGAPHAPTHADHAEGVRSQADPTAGSSNENRRTDLPVLAVVWYQAYTFALKVPVQLVDPSFAVVLVTPAVDAQPERNNAK